MQGLSPKERQQLLLSVGTHRDHRPLSPVEVGELFEKARAAGASFQECAEGAGFDGTSMVSRFLRLLKLSPEIRHLVDWGESSSTITFTAASELARLPNPEDQASAAQAVLEEGLSSGEVKQLVQLRLRSGKPMNECVAATLRMRPRVVRRHVFVGAVTSQDARDRLASYTQAQRDELFRLVLGEELPDLKGSSCRLGVERFTLVGGEELAAQLRRKYTDFEAGISEALQRSLTRHG